MWHHDYIVIKDHLEIGCRYLVKRALEKPRWMAFIALAICVHDLKRKTQAWILFSFFLWRWVFARQFYVKQCFWGPKQLDLRWSGWTWSKRATTVLLRSSPECRLWQNHTKPKSCESKKSFDLRKPLPRAMKFNCHAAEFALHWNPIIAAGAKAPPPRGVAGEHRWKCLHSEPCTPARLVSARMGSDVGRSRSSTLHGK